MDSLSYTVINIHIIGGFFALLFGLLPIFSKKGKIFHRITGKIYFISISIVALTSLLTFFLKPFTEVRLFLSFIGLFTLYLSFSGIRVLNSKNRVNFLADRIASVIIVLCGLAMTFVGLSNIYEMISHRENGVSNYFFTVLYGLFAWFSIASGREDFYRYYNRIEEGNSKLINVHISKMLGAYIATVTAFIVVNSFNFTSNLNVFIYIFPGALGALAINWFISYQKKNI